MMPKKSSPTTTITCHCVQIFLVSTQHITLKSEFVVALAYLARERIRGKDESERSRLLYRINRGTDSKVTYTGKISVGMKSDDELKRSAGEALTRKETKREEGEQDISKNDDRGEGEMTKKAVEIDASTAREEILESEPKMEDIDPEFMPKDDEGDIKLPPSMI